MPQAVVFTVRGKAASAFSEPVAVTAYHTYDREGRPEPLRPLLCPAIFVDHKKVADVVNAIARGDRIDGVSGALPPECNFMTLADGGNGPATRLAFA